MPVFTRNICSHNNYLAVSGEYFIEVVFMQLSDRDAVDLIRENPFIHFFLSYPDYQYDLALDASLGAH